MNAVNCNNVILYVWIIYLLFVEDAAERHTVHAYQVINSLYIFSDKLDYEATECLIMQWNCEIQSNNSVSFYRLHVMKLRTLQQRLSAMNHSRRLKMWTRRSFITNKTELYKAYKTLSSFHATVMMQNEE